MLHAILQTAERLGDLMVDVDKIMSRKGLKKDIDALTLIATDKAYAAVWGPPKNSSRTETQSHIQTLQTRLYEARRIFGKKANTKRGRRKLKS